jgi:hypothetical protein
MEHQPNLRMFVRDHDNNIKRKPKQIIKINSKSIKY